MVVDCVDNHLLNSERVRLLVHDCAWFGRLRPQESCHTWHDTLKSGAKHQSSQSTILTEKPRRQRAAPCLASIRPQVVRSAVWLRMKVVEASNGNATVRH